MSNITKFEKKDVQGIEFYVSNDGTQSGMSVSGLARLCGIRHQSISELVSNISYAGKSIPKSLEVLRSKEITSQVTGFAGNPTMVSSEACASIIEYYAFESRAKSQQALEAYRQFAKVGILNNELR